MTNPNTPEPNWHHLSADEALQQLQTTPAGLSQEAAARHRTTWGPNSLPTVAGTSGLKRFALQFHNILIYVLLGAAAITAALGHWADTVVILAVVLANAVIGFVQEGKAESAMNAIRGMLAPRAAVLRDGARITVDASELVPGDVVLLEAGDKVPADLRLLQAHGLQVQEAILTGESVPVEKHVRPVAAEAALGDRTSMAFSGTLVTAGQCHGLVVATGVRTEIGRISRLLAGIDALTTPLVQQMNRFSRWLTLVILVVAALLLAYGYFFSEIEFTLIFMTVVGLSVAAIPEGLPAVLTITLAVGVQAMARRNAIVRRLPAIETLGAVSVICTDKTGTLTRNEMAVASVVTAGASFAVKGEGYAPEGLITPAGDSAPEAAGELLAEIGRAAALCNDAALALRDGVWTVEGDPMEGALLAFAARALAPAREQPRAWPRIDTIAFDARHRFMATLHHDPQGRAMAVVKGAPERLLGMCRLQREADGSASALNPDQWHAAADTIAAQGQRVLALATRALPDGHTSLQHGDVNADLVLLGLVGLIDPPRPETSDAVAQCHQAGIRVKMITGDHAGTARAIGRQIGLQDPDRVLTGTDIDAMDDTALARAIDRTSIFARTSPEHKLRLVMALQARGLTVAMTGDGVNDAPALKRADAGIAMGLKGSEAAKDAAELVLADDHFATIVSAVREGRTVYDNIKKVISWTLPTNAGESLVIIIALLLGTALPVTPIQILWINLITASTLGIALAFEPTEANTMQRPPRSRNEPLLSSTLAWHIVWVSALFVCGVYGVHAWAAQQGHSAELARTMAVNTIVVMEIFHLFFIRNIYGTSLTWKAVRGTPMVWATVLIVTVAQFAITYLPPLQAVFGTQAVPLWDGVLIVAVGVALFAMVEIEKQVRLRLGRLRGAA